MAVLASEPEIDGIHRFMMEYAVEAGRVLMQYRGKVKREVKEGGVGGDQASGGTALSVVDKIIQEDFLRELHKLLKGRKDVRINCEEDTPLQELFRGNNGELCTVHQDPCDGTDPYLDGFDDFATGYGISRGDNRFTHTAIYVPAQKLLYCASPIGNRILDENLDDVVLGHKIPEHRKIFSKRVLNDKGIKVAAEMGFVVEGVKSAHCRIIDVAMRRAGAYLYGGANPHDSMIPYAFADHSAVRLTDIKGNPIEGKDIVVNEERGLPKFERIPSVAYMPFEYPYRQEIMGILSDPANLDEKVRKIL